MATHQATAPRAAVTYFGSAEHPIVARTFTQAGWTLYPMKKRVSGNWARQARAQGVTHVQLAAGGRLADFRIEELVR